MRVTAVLAVTPVLSVFISEVLSAHGAVGAEKVGDKNGNNGFANVSVGRKNVKLKRIFHKTPLQNSK